MLNTFLVDVTDRQGLLSPQRMSATLGMPMAHLARVAKLHRNSLSQHPHFPAVQARLGEVARVVATASDLLGGDAGKSVL